MRVAIYARKSISDPQSQSIENQINLSIQYCKDKLEYTSITKYCDEGYSGKNTNRPAFQDLLKDIYSSKIDYLLVYKMDRLFRNTKDFYNMIDIFEKYNIKFISITENLDLTSSSGRVMAGIYSVFAQFERESISQRIKDNMYEMAKKGSWLGGPAPFGYKFNRFYENNKRFCYLEEDYEKAEIVKLLFNKYLKLKSLTKLEKYVHEHSITGARGNIFNITSISTILRSPIYVKSTPDVVTYLKNQGMDVIGKPDYTKGFTTYAKNTSSMQQPLATISHHNGIIDGDIWLRVQDLLYKNSKVFPRQGTGKKAPLSGILKCKQCSSNMNISYKKRNANGKQLRYYVCSLKKRKGNNSCSCSNLNADYIEDLILNSINNIDINTANELLKNKNLLFDNLDYQSKELSLIENNILIKKRSLSNLTNALSTAPNEMMLNSILDKMNSISDELSELEIKLNSIKSNIEDVDSSIVEEIINNFFNFDNFISNECFERKTEFISNIIDKIEWDSTLNEINIIYK